MPSSSSLAAVLSIIGAVVLAVAPVFADEAQDEKAAKRAKVCAKADERYAELYPGAENDGVTVVKLYKYHFFDRVWRT